MEFMRSYRRFLFPVLQALFSRPRKGECVRQCRKALFYCKAGLPEFFTGTTEVFSRCRN